MATGCWSPALGGYTLELGREQLDSLCFEDLLGAGRRSLAAGDPAGAATRLREALALWHGPALADLASLEFVQPEIRRLEELRLLALMERIDADLALDRHAELIGELENLVTEHPLKERLRQQLMLALYRCGRQAEALTVYRDTSELLRRELGLIPGPGLQELERMVLQQDAGLTASQVAVSGEPPAPVCPFKGLAFFDGADAGYFCGRERLVSEAVARLVEASLVGIIGPSGIGKSSLVRAGLLPALSAGALPRSAGWRQLLVRPGAHPGAQLVRALGADGLSGALAGLGPGERLVLAVDQLEELFTEAVAESERAAFLDVLVAAATDPDRRVSVICVLRADFYGRCASYPAFAQLLSLNHLLVGPMDRSELRAAIKQPAARAGLEVEPALVDTLVAEVADEPGGLPLLSTTLLELWRARDGRTLRHEAYRESGGLRGAVSRLAEAAYARLTETERAAARSVMLRLAGGEEGALTRRRVPLPELEHVDGADRVLATLIDARLLTVDDSTIELSHEALLREWPRYRGWLEEDLMGRRLHAHLIAAAREWELRGRDPAELYRGARLTSALEWATQHDDWLNPLEREFLTAGRRAAERDAVRQRAQNRRLRVLLVAVGVLLVAVVGAGVVALAKQRSASRAARAAAADSRAALGRQLGAEAVSEPRLDVAMLWAREAVTLSRSEQTEGTLLTTLLRNPAVIGAFSVPLAAPLQPAISPDGSRLAVGDPAEGTITFYSAATHLRAGAPISGFAGTSAPVYSPDGTLLAYPTQTGGRWAVVVRDARTRAVVGQLALGSASPGAPGPDFAAGTVLFAPNDQTVYDAYGVLGADRRPAGAYLAEWSLAGGRSEGRIALGSGRLLAARLVDGGRRLVTVVGDRIVTVALPSGHAVASVAADAALGQATAAAIGSSGTEVAAASPSGAMTFLSAVGATPRHGAGGAVPGSGAVAAVLFAGARVTTIGANGTVRLWDPSTGRAVQTFAAPPGQVQGTAETPDGSTLVTSAVNGDLLLWDLTGTRQFGRAATPGRRLTCCSTLTPHDAPLAVSPDGGAFAIRLGASTVGVFSTATLARLSTFTVGARGGVITALAWSPTGPTLAVAGHAGLLQLWNVAGRPRLLHSLTALHVAPGHPEAIQAVAFSPDGQLVAASDESEAEWPDVPAMPTAFVAIWRTGSGALVSAPSQLELGASPSGFDALAFSPAGDLLAAGLPNGRVLVIDALSGQALQTLAPPSGATSLAFAPDGTLATGTAAGTVALWNPRTGARLGSPLIASSAPIADIAFEPDGERFATAGYQDGTIKLWFTATLQQEGPPLALTSGATATAAFAGADLLAVDARGAAYTWPTGLGAWEQRACAVAGRGCRPGR